MAVADRSRHRMRVRGAHQRGSGLDDCIVWPWLGDWFLDDPNFPDAVHHEALHGFSHAFIPSVFPLVEISPAAGIGLQLFLQWRTPETDGEFRAREDSS